MTDCLLYFSIHYPLYPQNSFRYIQSHPDNGYTFSILPRCVHMTTFWVLLLFLLSRNGWRDKERERAREREREREKERDFQQELARKRLIIELITFFRLSFSCCLFQEDFPALHSEILLTWGSRISRGSQSVIFNIIWKLNM